MKKFKLMKHVVLAINNDVDSQDDDEHSIYFVSAISVKIIKYLYFAICIIERTIIVNMFKFLESII